MKILAFADLHSSLKALNKVEELAKKEKPDVIVCAGDISILERGLELLMHRLNELNKPVLFVHGNHESEQSAKKICSLFKNISFIHKKTYKIGNALFFGYGGGGFSISDSGFTNASRALSNEIKQNKDKKVILVAHAPPYGTKVDKVNGEHCGNKSITQFIKNNKVDLVICGHLHENFGKEDKIGKTKIINPGPFGKIISVN